MKTNAFHKTVLIFAVAVSCLTGCNKSDDYSYAGGQPLHFDKSDLIFDSASSSGVIEILETKGWDKPEAWGVASVSITVGEKTSVSMTPFVIEENNKGDKYNVYIDPVVGEWFSVKKEGGKILINVNENNGAERKLKIQINAGGSGSGEILVTQKRKS
jgi:hypothetical protein